HLTLRSRENPSGRPDVEFMVATGLAGRLGPVEFAVAEFGFALRVIRLTEDELAALPPGRDPLFGTLDLQLGFSPPEGIGLVLDAGGAKGGGYLYADPE